MTPSLQLSHVSVRLRGRHVIDDFSAEFNDADYVALIGSNGSGKTTILRAIMGLTRYCEGEIRLFGELSHALRRRIAYVPQAPVFDFKMPVTVRDVVAMGRYAERGIGRRLTADDFREVCKSMDEVGVGHLRDRPIGHLSGGERQKVQVARALCQSPDVLLLDEPTGNLDLGAQYECLDLISDIHERMRFTIILVMHDLQALPQNCNRAIIIDKGRKFFDGRFADVFTLENLSRIYKHRAERVMDRLAAGASDKSAIP